MSVSIKNIRSAKNGEWDHIWRGCDYATYFHSREWAEIWNTYTKGKMCPDPKLVIFTDGKKALLPLSYQNNLKGLIKNYISSPAGTFGGWISVDGIDTNHAILLTKFLNEKLSSLVWRINPYDGLISELGVQASEYDETYTLSLEVGFEVIYKKWTKGHRSAARKAHELGVSVKLASTLEDWKSYYYVYKDSLRRWGNQVSSRYGWGIFHEMFQRDSPNLKLWLALCADKSVVAGAIVLYAKRHVVYWHGAALEEYFSLRPVNLLLYEIIKNASEEKYFWFDFNPSGGHKGVAAFKKSFGVEVLPCPIIYVKTAPLISRIRVK